MTMSKQLSTVNPRSRHHIHLMGEGVILARPHHSGRLIQAMGRLTTKFEDEKVHFRDFDFRTNPLRREGMTVLNSQEMRYYTNLSQQPAIAVLQQIYSNMPRLRQHLKPRAESFAFNQDPVSGKYYGRLEFARGAELLLEDDRKKVESSLRQQNAVPAPALTWSKPGITLVEASATVPTNRLIEIVNAAHKYLPMVVDLDQLRMLDSNSQPIIGSDRLPQVQ